MKKKKLRNKWVVMWLVIALLSMSGCSVVVVENPTEGSREEVKEAEVTQKAEMTNIPRPQDDFYGYVNKEALMNCALNHFEDSYGTFQSVDEMVQQELFLMLQDIVDSKEEYAPGSSEQVIREVYLQCLAYLKGADSSAKACFEAKAERIQSADSVEDIQEVMAELSEEQGINLFFSPTVTQHLYKNGEYTVCLYVLEEIAGFSLKDIYEDDTVRQELFHFAWNVWMAVGEDRDKAEAKAKAFVYDMISLAEHTDFEQLESNQLFENIQIFSFEALDKTLANNTGKELMELYDLWHVTEWEIVDEGQLKAIDALFCEEKLDSLKTYMLCSLTYEYVDFLRREYDFLDTYQKEEAPEELAILYVSRRFSRLVSEVYAKTYYTEQMNADVKQMYEDIVEGYRKLITQTDWLSDQTRAGMLEKLENMVLICGSDKQLVNTSEILGKDAFETFLNNKRMENENAKAQLGTTVDRKEAGTPSHVVNASYDAMSNAFTITVAIMHAPFYAENQSYAANMGGLGAVMCHEIGHAFDSNCLAFDADGVYNPEWICEEDRQKLKERLTAMEAYYAGFTVMDIYHVDGVKTSGENYADKGAMECLMKIVTTPEEREALFENYARIWCSMTEDSAAISLLAEDVHSPDRVRTNAVLSSTPEFYEVYEVQPEDGMYIPPSQRVSRWK